MSRATRRDEHNHNPRSQNWPTSPQCQVPGIKFAKFSTLSSATSMESHQVTVALALSGSYKNILCTELIGKNKRFVLLGNGTNP